MPWTGKPPVMLKLLLRNLSSQGQVSKNAVVHIHIHIFLCAYIYMHICTICIYVPEKQEESGTKILGVVEVPTVLLYTHHLFQGPA